MIAPQLAFEIFPARRSQLFIKNLEIVELRNGHHEVPSRETNERFRVSLLVRPTNQTEVMLVEVMAFQLQKAGGQHAVSFFENLRHRNAAVVVADPFWHGIEKLECPTVTFLKGFGAFARKRLTEESITVRQRHDKKGDLPLSTTIDDRRLA